MLPTRAQSAAILLLTLPAIVTSAQPQTLAITGATVIDGTGKPPLSDGVVLISDGRIAAVGRSGEVAIPAGARRLNARGKYVIPGLMDGVNQPWPPLPGDVETFIKYQGHYHELILEAAQIALKGGVTTAFVAYTHRPAMKARDMINAGDAPGSRIYVRGTSIGHGPRAIPVGISQALAERITEELGKGMGRELLWMTPEELRSVIREYIQKHDIDYVKYGSSDPTGPFIRFSPRAQRVIVEEGHRAGLTVQAHTMSVEALVLAVEAGVDILTHGDFTGPTTPIPEETIRKLVERGVFVGVLPVTQRHLEAVKKHGSSFYGADWHLYLKVAKTNQRNMIKAGVTMLLGTEAFMRGSVRTLGAADTVEASLHGTLGEAHFYALMALEEEGMDPMKILKTATSNVARAYKLDAGLGTLEAGKIADLLILDGNPLESARNYRRIHEVIKDGRVVDRDELPLLPLLTAIEVACERLVRGDIRRDPVLAAVAGCDTSATSERN